MGVKQVPVSSDGAWDVPLAAIFCFAIVAYVAVVILGKLFVFNVVATHSLIFVGIVGILIDIRWYS